MKKLVITDYNMNNTSGNLSMLFEDNREIRIGIYDNEESVLGNIYVARVRDIVRNIDAAFVEIAPGKVCYFSIRITRVRCSLTGKIRIKYAWEI